LRLASALFVVVLIVIFVEAPRLPTEMTIMIATEIERRSRLFFAVELAKKRSALAVQN